MLTPEICQEVFGEPGLAFERQHMMVWRLPVHLQMQVEALPGRIYLNKRLRNPLENALTNLVVRGYASEMDTWDGCFVVRPQRGSSKPSLHSWGVAIDVNAKENGLGREPQLSAGFVKCFTDAGFDWGGNWKRKDGMHFQLKRELVQPAAPPAPAPAPRTEPEAPANPTPIES